MNFRADPNFDISGTSLRGTIQATLGQLTQVFGQPGLGEPGDRVLARWAIKTDDGQLVTIYCWRFAELPAADTVVSWNIGGRNDGARNLAHALFRAQLGLKAAA